jgi:hypothetical protein
MRHSGARVATGRMRRSRARLGRLLTEPLAGTEGAKRQPLEVGLAAADATAAGIGRRPRLEPRSYFAVESAVSNRAWRATPSRNPVLTCPRIVTTSCGRGLRVCMKATIVSRPCIR